MLMPSAITGWASPAILPVKKTPSLYRRCGCRDGSGRWTRKLPSSSASPNASARALGGFQDMGQHRFARFAAMTRARPRQRIAADAAGQRDAPGIGYAPTRHSRREKPASGISPAGRAPPRKCALKANRSDGADRARGTAKTPLVFQDPQAAMTMRAAISRPSSRTTEMAFAVALARPVTSAGCKSVAPAATAASRSISVQMFAAQRPAPGLFARRRQHRVAGIGADPHDRGPGRGNKGRGNAAGLQHRHGGGGNEFAAHLAAGKFRFLDQGHMPARLGQQPRRRGTGRARANDQRVITHGRANTWVKGKMPRSRKLQA